MVNATDERRWTTISSHLFTVLNEIEAQESVGSEFPPSIMGFLEQIANIREYIEVNELGLAYECIIAMLEHHSFSLSGRAAVKLVEVALLMGFKTEADEDRQFDSR